MGALLAKVIAEVAKHEQDTIAAWILEEVQSEKRWETGVSNALNQLESLAEQVLADHRKDRTPLLDPDRL